MRTGANLVKCSSYLTNIFFKQDRYLSKHYSGRTSANSRKIAESKKWAKQSGARCGKAAKIEASPLGQGLRMFLGNRLFT